MKQIKIEVSKVKPNPFKKFVNGGKLNEFIVEKLVEGFKQTRFHENICAREDDGIELIYGHHRLEAVKRVYGNKHIINLNVYSKEEFTDDMMLIDMVRENITHRDVDFQDKREAVVLAHNWLSSKSIGVKQFNTAQQRDKFGKFKPTENSCRSIAKFLSKEGKTISYVSVRNYLQMSFNLDKTILDKIEKSKGGNDKEDKTPVWQGQALSQFKDKQEQKDLLKSFQKSREQRRDKINQHLTKYKESPKILKEKIRKQRIDIADISYDIPTKQSMELERTAINVANDILGNYARLTSNINEIVKEMNIKDLDKELLKSLTTSSGVYVKISLPKLLRRLIEFGGKPDKQLVELINILK